MLCLLLGGRTKKYRIPRGTAEDNTPETLVKSRAISFTVLIQPILSRSNTSSDHCYDTQYIHNIYNIQKHALHIPAARCDAGMQTVANPSQGSAVLWESRECGQGHLGPSGSLCPRRLPHLLKPRD